MKNRTIITLALGAVVGAYLVAENEGLEHMLMRGKKRLRSKMNRMEHVFR